MAAGPTTERNLNATIYVEGLHVKVTDTILHKLFVQAGPVVNIHLPKDRVTQSHQGFGFVEFLSEDFADYAIKIMNMIEVFGKPIRVSKASAHQKNLDVGANVFIGNLDPEVDEKLLYDTFSAFGVILQTPKIMRHPKTGNSKGFAFINYASFEASDAAIDAMNGQHLCNRPVSVSYAYKKDGKGERHGSAAERLLAAQNPLSQADRPHQLFADAPPTAPLLAPGGPPPMGLLGMPPPSYAMNPPPPPVPLPGMLPSLNMAPPPPMSPPGAVPMGPGGPPPPPRMIPPPPWQQTGQYMHQMPSPGHAPPSRQSDEFITEILAQLLRQSNTQLLAQTERCITAERKIAENAEKLKDFNYYRYCNIVRNEISKFEEYAWKCGFTNTHQVVVREYTNWEDHAEDKRRRRISFVLRYCNDPEVIRLRKRIPSGINIATFAGFIARAYRIISTDIHSLSYSIECAGLYCPTITSDKNINRCINSLMTDVEFNVGRMVPVLGRVTENRDSES